MQTLKIDILNPKATDLLKSLADLELIAIRETEKTDFSSVLQKLRNKGKSSPSLEEITRETESVRKKRYK